MYNYTKYVILPFNIKCFQKYILFIINCTTENNGI